MRCLGNYQKYFGLTLLFTINTINYLDRLGIAAVLTQITEFYSFSAFQSGLLSTCFLVGYMLSAPLFGYLGDKYSRKWILVSGIVFWSLSAFSASLIGKDHSVLFFISRMCVGVGEASYSTVAPTIIADLFEPEQRKLGLSIFYFAVPIGSGMGFLMGNLALQLGDWRWVFRLTPAVGLIATFFLLMLDEPVRGQSDGASSDTVDTATIKDNLVYLAGIRSYVWSTIGFTGCLFAMGALSWWGINFMGIACGQDYEKTATLIFGVIVFAAGFIGVTLGSSAAQHYRKYDGRSDPIVCAVGVILAVPFIFLGLLLARSATNFGWILLFLAVTALSTNWAIVSDMLLSVTLPNKRAFATSIQILLSHLFGDATSPSITGFIRDQLLPIVEDEYRAFLYSLMSTLIILILGAFAFIKSAKYFVQDVDNCKVMLGKRIIQTSTDASDLTDFASGHSHNPNNSS